jgi:pyruvate formate lyase activating enzyme
MSEIIGSRYQTHVARQGAEESRKARDYFSIYPTDVAELQDGDDLIGYVHSWEVGSTVDGPGLRFVGFLTGCLLRCQYCHNPDTWHKHNGHAVTVARAAEVIGRFAHSLKVSGGGVTLSGGEPQLQRQFVNQVIRRCKQLGLHTCIDTSGRLGEKFTDAELMEIDLHLLDIKSGDPAIYERVTRQPLQPTLDFARRLAALKRPMWIRYVLVPGLTDGYDNVEKVADFVGTLGSVERVEILRFHQMGRDKWHKLGLEYTLEKCDPPDPELTRRVHNQFHPRGLTVYS